VTVGLSGNLRDFGIADVFQLIGQQRKTGVLELTNSDARIHMHFDRGAVVNAAPAGGRAADLDPLGDMLMRCGRLTRERVTQAQAASRASAQTFTGTLIERGWIQPREIREIEDLLTRDTIFEVLRWESGTFDFRAQDLAHDRDPSSLLGAEQILMDGLRMLDEWRSFAGRVPADDAVYQRVGRFESYRDRQETPSPAQLERAQRLFSLIDGRLPIRRVIDLSRLGTFDATRVLAELVEAGLIKPLHPEGVRVLRKLKRAASARRGIGLSAAIAGTIATAVPVALLAAAAVMAMQSEPPAAEPVVAERNLAWLREAYATRRVRNALDAYHLTHGGWPSEISELPSQGYLDQDALSAPPGRPYYSANRDDGVVFLAPEH
jgi:hypothetical protein